MRRLDGLPVLLVATLRTGERHDGRRRCSPSSSLDPATALVRPGPLTAEGVADLVRARLGEPDAAFVAACHRTTAGNPLLLRQLLRALEADGVRPDAAHADTVMAIGSRAVVEHGPHAAAPAARGGTAVARAIAVLGDGAELPTSPRSRTSTRQRPRRRSPTCARAEMPARRGPARVRPPAGPRRRLPSDLPRGERAAGARARRAGARRRGAPAEQVAAHLLLAPAAGTPTVVDVLRAAARTARRAGAPESAVTYLRRALAEPARGPAAPGGAARARPARDAGRRPGRPRAPAAPRTSCVTEPTARAELAVTIAWTHVFASSPGVASAFAREAAAALPGDLVDARQGLLALERISGFMHGLDPAVWQAGAEPVRAGRRRRRPDAGRGAGLGGHLRGDRPGPGRGAGPVRPAGRRAARPSTAGCSGWWRRTRA